MAALLIFVGSCTTEPVQTSTATDQPQESTPNTSAAMPDSVTAKTGPDQMIPENTAPLTQGTTAPQSH